MINKEFDYKKIMSFGKEVLSFASPSGYTNNVIDFLLKECLKRNVEAYKSNNGSLIATIKGESDYVVGLAAHADTLGAMVKNINADGTLKFSPIGSPILPTYDGEYCKVITREGKEYSATFLSNSPAIHVYKDSKTLSRNEETMHVRLDEVVFSRDDVKKLGISNGDIIAIDPKTVITESGFIKSRFLDDKISVALLFAVIDYLKENNITPKYTLKIIITVNEEEGFGASYVPEINELLAVDMGCVGMDLEGNEYKVSIYNELTQKGMLRHVLVRKNYKDELMVVLITNGHDLYNSDVSANTYLMTSASLTSSAYYPFMISNKGKIITNDTGANFRSVRPVITIIKTALVEGDGTVNNPYVLTNE